MPAPVERFARTLTRLEDRAVGASLVAWKRARPQLLDAITTAGDPALSVHAVLAATGRDVDRGLGSLAPLVAGAASALVLAETGIAVELALTLGAAAWQAATLGLFLAELQQLQAARATEAAIIARLITGRDGRASIYQLAENALQLHTRRALWAAGNGAVLNGGQQASRMSGIRYQKQVHAALDARTTECCRRANGQIRDLDELFTLTGTPRFADRMQAPPFHAFCRTAISLYTPEMEAARPRH